MGQSLLLCVNIIIIQFHKIESQSTTIINCYGDTCGPCSNPLIPCNLKCNGYEDCKDAQLTCTSGDESECIIDCDGEKSCLSTLIQAPDTSKLNINCNHEGSCEQTIIYSGADTDVTLNCDGFEKGCEELTLYAQNSNNVNINCKDFHSCVGLSVFCGTGECLIDCHFGDNGCQNMNLYCGSATKCQINCSGLDSCQSMIYHTANANSFECIGTTTQCQNAPSPFTNPTQSPTPKPTVTVSEAVSTVSPTKTPTAKPTFKPTKLPTNRPTLSTEQTIPTIPKGPPEFTNTNSRSTTTMIPTKSIRTKSSTTVNIISTVSNGDDTTKQAITTTTTTSSPTIGTKATVASKSVDFEMFPDSTFVTGDTIDSGDKNEPDSELAKESSSSANFYIYLMLICIGIAILICCCVPLCICLCNKMCGSSDGTDNVNKKGSNDSSSTSTATRIKSLSIDGPKWNEFTIPSNLSKHQPKQSMLEHQHQNNHHNQEQEINENLSHHIEDSDSNDIYTWFNEKVKLPQYAERFISNGFGDLSLIQQLVNMEELEKMGVVRLDHRFQIMAEINKLENIMSPIVMGSDQSDEPSDISNINININAPKIKLALNHGLHSNTMTQQTRTRTPKYNNYNIGNDEFIVHDGINDNDHEATMGIIDDDEMNDRVIQRMLTPHANDYYGHHNKLNSHDVLALEISQMDDDIEDSIETLNSPQLYVEHKIKGVSIQRIMDEDIYEYGRGHNGHNHNGHNHMHNNSIHGEKFVGSFDSFGNGLNAPHPKMPNRASILTNQFSEGKDDDRQIGDVLNEMNEDESMMKEMVTLAAPQTSTSSDLFRGDQSTPH